MSQKMKRFIGQLVISFLLVFCFTGTADNVLYTPFAIETFAAAKPAKPKSSKKAGTYAKQVKIKLSDSTKGAVIYYTTNGKTPTTKSTRYKKEFTLKKSATIKAVAIKKKAKSSVLTVKYKVIALKADADDNTNSQISLYKKAILYSGISYMPSAAQQICNKVNKVIKDKIKPGMSKADKVRKIHDYIILNTKYDNEDLDKGMDPPLYSFTVQGALMKGTAVCRGYAETFQLFMEVLKIDSKIVSGTGQGVSHAWNMVKLEDGNWYQVDTTWDDPLPDKKGYVGNDYLLVSDTTMKKEHSWDTSKYPACNGGKYEDYGYVKSIASSISEFETVFAEQYNDGKRYIIVVYPEKEKIDESIIKKYTNKYEVTYDQSGKYTISLVVAD